MTASIPAKRQTQPAVCAFLYDIAIHWDLTWREHHYAGSWSWEEEQWR